MEGGYPYYTENDKKCESLVIHQNYGVNELIC
jgi:hypothetical protein